MIKRGKAKTLADKVHIFYEKFQRKDGQKIGQILLDDRLILSQLVTNSPADNALRYVWANRSLAQVSHSNSSAILSLGGAPKADLLARKASLIMRRRLDLAVPSEISNQEDLDKFLRRTRMSRLVIKQNYPSDNEEFSWVKKFNFGTIKLEIANKKIDYDVIESKRCLANLCNKPESWIEHAIDKYLRFVLRKNDVILSEKEIIKSVEHIKMLTSSLLIPSKVFKGLISSLIDEIKKLTKENFFPVFKFPYSVSGFGVHYPKRKDGSYDIFELQQALKNDQVFLIYLAKALSKNGQKIDQKILKRSIEVGGIVLQKHISGSEHSAGYFKPLPSQAERFFLGINNLVVTDVLVEGTDHFGNVLCYESAYLSEILRNTLFEDQPGLFHLSIELILYLMYLDQKRVKSPKDFKFICVEDFGIQFIINKQGREVGLVEFNGRTPSPNFNHFHLLSKYNLDPSGHPAVPMKFVLFTNSIIISAKEFCNEENNLAEFVDGIIKKVKHKYGNRCELVSFQIIDDNLTINYGIFFKSKTKQKVAVDLKNIKKFFLSFAQR